jgi:hypothetical protein
MANADLIVRLDTTGMDRILRETPGKLRRFLDQEAENVVNDIKLSFGTSPSAPGDPPGVDTGALRASITWVAQGKFTRMIHDGMEYGTYMEFGTEHIAPRPWLGPAMERVRRTIHVHARAFGLVE